ncbi:hypothetical protein PVK06_040782 [Gossypium arboreum]|uniref:DUF7745 domain-containing protein n=1 Tax=Gossypium arboreum TaxID=29729 RepID=A0ABR0N6D7_GOSAR|nr:hypothetical protein PVK06_040782 [Gossypium arboreum]
MRNEYLDRVEDNASVCTWLEKTQLEKGDSVTEGYTSELWDFTRINSTQNEFQELRNIWAQWDDEAKQLFYQNYGDLPYLLDVKVDRHLFRAMALGHIDEAVTDLFDRVGKQNTPVLAILAETFRSLSACWRAGEGRFIGCAQLLLVWFHSHFWKLDKVLFRVFFEGYSPLKEAVDMPRRDDISEERWIDILQNLREEDVMWKAPWLAPSEVLYRCGSFD